MQERTKKIWLYCTNCDFQKASVYFNPPICPRCKRGLQTLTLTKAQYDKHGAELLETGCKRFAKRYIIRGNFVEPI